MHIGFLNPQGNFDSKDSHLTEHPDFGGQLVYVKEVAIAMACHGHKVDILTRQIIDDEWPEFANTLDAYPGVENVRIIRLPAGPKEFLRKELLWPHLIQDWVPNILKFYSEEGSLPDIMTTHYGDGGICGVLIEEKTGIPFTFTAHSLGAQKLDKLKATPDNLAQLDQEYHFGRRLVAERLSMNRSAINITNSQHERFHQYRHSVYEDATDVESDTCFTAVPPGVKPDLFGPDASTENEETTYDLVRSKLQRDIAPERQDLPVIVASSRLALKKNLQGLVEAFAQSALLQEKANLVLITAGLDNPLQEEVPDETTEQKILAPIREIVKANNLSGKISAFSVPNQTALAAMYRFLAKRRSVFALTSLYEPFGLAPLEAAAAGLPIVVTQNGGLNEELKAENKECGIFVNPESVQSIAQGLEHLIGNEEEWDKFAQLTQKLVLDKFTWEDTALDYLNLIEKIMETPKRYRYPQRLPIHPYFLNPQSENDVSLEELSQIYFD